MKERNKRQKYQSPVFEPVSIVKEKRAWNLLHNNENFKKSIRHIRKKYRIPQSGYSNKQLEKFLLSEEITKIIGIVEDLDKLLKKYKLMPTLSWFEPILLYIFLNKELPPYTTKVQIEEETIEKEKVLVIKIHQRLNKTEFISLIERRWDDIEAKMNNLPRLKIRKITTLQLAKKVITLRNKNKTYVEIADIVSNDYPNDDSGRINEDYMKTLFHRYKDILS